MFWTLEIPFKTGFTVFMRTNMRRPIKTLQRDTRYVDSTETDGNRLKNTAWNW
jgi:hypothetical protein